MSNESRGPSLNILLMSWNFPPVVGGIEYVVGNLFEGLRNDGHSVRLVTAYHEGAAHEAAIARCPSRGFLRFLWYSARTGRAMCKADRPDVILCGSVAVYPVAFILSRIFHLPIAVMLYGSDIVHSGRVYQAILSWILHSATRLCAISRYTRELAISKGAPGERVEVIYPGISTRSFDSRQQGGSGDLVKEMEGRRVLLTVGRLIRRKGIVEFIENVVPELATKFPDLLYLVAGDDATRSLIHKERLRGTIERRVHELGLQHHVRLLGPVPETDLVRLFFRADVFVLPCLETPGDIEGFGIVLCEAALAGTPGVATRVGGIPEVIEDGVTGFLVEAGDYRRMAVAISTLLQDEALRRRMADEGERLVRSRFSLDEPARQLVRVLRQMAAWDRAPRCGSRLTGA